MKLRWKSFIASPINVEMSRPNNIRILSLWLVFTCFCHNESYASDTDTFVVGGSGVNGTIVMGYLMDQIGPPYRIGAIGMAIARGQEEGLLPGYNFRYVTGNCRIKTTGPVNFSWVF